MHKSQVLTDAGEQALTCFKGNSPSVTDLMRSINACLSSKALPLPYLPQRRKQAETIRLVSAGILQSRNLRKKICVGAVGWLGCPRTAGLLLCPGVTFQTNQHFACTGLVYETSLHVQQSSLTSISSSENNTPYARGCVAEHLKT